MSEKIHYMNVSAEELEKLLASIPKLISKSSIIETWRSGTSEQVISASALSEILKTLNTRSSGEGLKQQINAAEDSNVLTDSLLERLNNVTVKFIGEVADISARNELVTTEYTGGETILLRSNDYGNATIQTYSNATDTWVDLFPDMADERTVTVTASGSTVVRSFSTATDRLFILEIMGYTATLMQSSTVKIGKLPSVTDPYVSVGSEFKTNDSQRVFQVLPSMNGNTLEVRVTTLVDNAQIRVALLSKM